MILQAHKVPFLFRSKKPTITPNSKFYDISSPVSDGMAIINVEEKDDLILVSANKTFLTYINQDERNPIGLKLSKIFWGEDIDDNRLYSRILKAYTEKRALAFIWKLNINSKQQTILCKIIPLQNKNNKIKQITIITSNYEENNELELELERYNYFDPLTGLPNNYKFLDLLEEKYGSNSSVQNDFHTLNNIEAAILFINIKKLQRINESFGYDYGDEAIKAFAALLKSNLPDEAHLSRFSNDNFVIFITDEYFGNVKQEAQTLAQSIHHNMASKSILKDSNIHLSASIGIASGQVSKFSIQQLLQNAHLAMKRNNEHSTNQTIIFNQDIKTQAQSKLSLETELREALNTNTLELHYQPLINLQNGSVYGFEALARWNNSKRGEISPNDFIALAEEAGLIIPLGEWALNTACQNLKSWIDENPLASNLFMAVNVSSTHILNGNIMALTRDALAKSGISSRNLKLELTESTIMENSDIARNILLDLKTLGISLAVDDFGTGYSSLSYLSRIPADNIKIDRSFVNKIDNHKEGQNIIKVIINLANSLGMTVIAEGIETEEQLLLLKKLGCHYGQGFLFSKAIPAADIPDFIKKNL